VKIDIKLSDLSIRNAIKMLEDAKDNLEYGVEQTIDILAKNGATIAQTAYGGMADVDYESDETTAIIVTSGKANIIAEFGAGDATEVPTGFDSMPDTPVYPGSYSEDHAQMYAKYGWWRFGGRVYTQVEPRHGLMQAKVYIVEEGTDVAKEVIKL
jgi:hypothetical protein